ncbi:MAG: hypothetical protein ACXWLH_03900 [Candidatus Saccharimonadales bacterium]
MAEENTNQEPTTAPEVDKSRPKPVVTPAAVNPESAEDDKDLDEFKVEPTDESAAHEETISESEPPAAGTTISPKKDFTPPKKRHGKKPLLVLFLLAIIAAGGYLGWTKYFKKSNLSTSSTSSANSQQSSGPNTFVPVSVAYAFRTSTNVPYKVYTRQAEGGGQHTEANLKLATSETIDFSDTNGLKVVIATDKAIYSSTDGGKTYKLIVKLDIGNNLSSLKISVEGDSIIYSLISSADTSSDVRTVNLDGGSNKSMFVAKAATISVIAYSSAKQSIVYRQGGFGDMPSALPVLRDRKGKVTDLIKDITPYELQDISVSHDYSTLVYAQAVENPDGPIEGLGKFTAAPYTINSINLTTFKLEQLTTFGTKDEKNPNGTFKSRDVKVGFMAGTNTPYYTDDGKLYEVENGESTKVYEVANKILYLPFVGKDMIIAGYGNQTSDYFLDSYNVSTKKSANIYSGDDNTIIFGVTTK